MKELVRSIMIGLVLAGCGPSCGSGSMAFSPATESCSAPAAWTETVQLPSSVKAGDAISYTLDGKQVTSATVSPTSFTQKADGSWTSITQLTVAELQAGCSAGGLANGVGVLTPGTHTAQVLDSSGKVLAQGTYTVTT